jgi:S1-C subfamily serine protease
MRSRKYTLAAMVLFTVACAPVLAQDHAHAQAPPASPANQGFLGGKFAPVEGPVAEQLDLEEQDGVVVVEIVPGSPAERAGLQLKDILKKIDGKQIMGVDDFRETMRGTKPGKTLKLTILRGTETRELSVTLGERPKDTPSTAPTTKP